MPGQTLAPPPAPPAPPTPPPPSARPKTLRDYVRDTAEKYEVDPELAFTIINRESRGIHQAADGALTTGDPTKYGQAQGMFQLLPQTAAAYKLDPTDPFQNIEAGIRNIREAKDRDPNPAAIFAYYHGGSDKTKHGPVTAQYVQEALEDFKGRLAARERDAAIGTAAPARTERPGDIPVPTAAEVAAKTGQPPPTDPTAPPAPPWYAPQQLLETGLDLSHGAMKSVIGATGQLGRAVHKIPGVTTAVDSLYGTPGLSQRAFADVDKQVAPVNRTEEVGKVGGDIGTAIAMGGPVTRTGLAVAGRVAPRLAPYVGETAATLLPRAAVEAGGAAAIGKMQGQDPTTAAGIAAALPAVGTVARLPFAGKLAPVAREAVDWGRRQGIPVDLMASTANKFGKNIQKWVEATPLGAAVRVGAEGRQARALTRVGQSIADDIHPASTGRLQAAQSTGNALDQRVAQVGARAKRHYQVVEQIHADPVHTQRVPTGKMRSIPSTTPGGAPTLKPVMTKMAVPVDITSVRQAMRPLLQALKRQPAAVRDVAPLPAIQSLFKGGKEGKFRSLLDLEADLSAIKKLADTKGALGNRGQGLAKQAVKAMQDAIDVAAFRADPKMLDALQRARKATALKYQVDKLRTLFSGAAQVRTSRGDQAAKGYRLATAPDDINFEAMARIAKQVGPTEMRKLGRGYLENLLDKATKDGGFKHMARIASDWEKLGAQTKALFYRPHHIESLDNFFRLGRQLAEHPNPSGSGLMVSSGSSVGGLFYDPVKTLGLNLGAGALAALMNTERGVRLLTQGLTLPGGSAAAGAWAQQVKHLLDEQGEGDTSTPPPKPPAQGDGELHLRLNSGPPPR